MNKEDAYPDEFEDEAMDFEDEALDQEYEARARAKAKTGGVPRHKLRESRKDRAQAKRGYVEPDWL